MKLKVDFPILSLFILVTSGCIKTGTKEIIMPDQEIRGNQGYLSGAPPVQEVKEPKKKKILTLEIEVPSFQEKERTKIIDKDIWGNRGYIYRKKERMKYLYIEPSRVIPKKKTGISEPRKEPSAPVEEKKEKSKKEIPPAEEYFEYKVKEGESLWSIAKKLYGDATKWTLIYEYNKDLLKKPKMIKPGMILKIPWAKEVEFIK